MLRYGNTVFSGFLGQGGIMSSSFTMVTSALQEAVKVPNCGGSRFIKYTVYNVKGCPTKCKSRFITNVYKDDSGEIMIRFRYSYIMRHPIGVIEFPAKAVRFKNHDIVCENVRRYLESWRKLYDN